MKPSSFILAKRQQREENNSDVSGLQVFSIEGKGGLIMGV
jgi:hypothetical protein